MRIVISFVFLLACIAFADTGIQNDWSGGPGEEGPVTDWGNSFLSSVLLNWSDDAGNLFLDQMATCNHIREVDDLVWAKACYLDNDEYPDVFVTDGEDGSKWFRNVFSCSGWAIRDFADTPNIEDIATADIDGDGDYDVFASVDCYVTHGFFWYERLNILGTQWQSHEIDTENDPRRVHSLDFDGDGDIDLIGSYEGKSISWWENQSNGQNWVKHVISENAMEHGISSIDVADCDNDGDFDVVCGSSYSDEMYLFVNSGSGAWEFHAIEYQSEGDLREVSFADIDGDGLPDLVTVAEFYTSDVLWFRNTGNPSSWSLFVIPIDVERVRKVFPGDVNDDGNMDIVVVGTDGYPINHIIWLENISPTTGCWVHHDAYSDSLGYVGSVLDVNQDGRCDVVSYNRYSSSTYNKVVWWNLNSGYATGTAQLESSILYVYDVNWGSIDWSAITPDYTSVSFEVRSSDDPEDMGDWSAVITSPGSLASYLVSNDSYLQYRATLSTTDSTITPVLENVVLTWTTTGIEGSENHDEISLSVLQNPSAGSVRFGVNLPSAQNVTIAVYDAAGRVVIDTVNGEYQAGSTVVQLDMLQPGNYFCRMQADGQTFTEQFTIIRD